MDLVSIQSANQTSKRGLKVVKVDRLAINEVRDFGVNHFAGWLIGTIATRQGY